MNDRLFSTRNAERRARRLETVKYPAAPARRPAAEETAAARKSPRVAGATAGPGVGDSEGWRAAARADGGQGAAVEEAVAAAKVAVADAATAVAAAATAAVRAGSGF